MRKISAHDKISLKTRKKSSMKKFLHAVGLHRTYVQIMKRRYSGFPMIGYLVLLTWMVLRRTC